MIFRFDDFRSVVTMTTNASVLLLPLLLLTVVHDGSAAYCDDNMFEARSPGVQFTKELSTFEYGTVGSFKTLHCCGEKYLSLEW